MHVLIELPNWIGDCVMSTPAIENIINNFSNEYCNTDDNWDKELTKIIKKLEVGSL